MKERRRSKSEEHPAPVTTASDADENREEPLAPQFTHAAATGETTTAIKDETVTAGLSQAQEPIGETHGAHAQGHDPQLHSTDTQTGQGMHGVGTQLHDPPVGFGSTTMERSFGNEPSTGAGVTTSGSDFAASTIEATPTDEGNGRI